MVYKRFSESFTRFLDRLVSYGFWRGLWEWFWRGSVEGWFVAAPRFCGGLQGSREEVYGGAAARTLEVGQVARCFPDLDRVSGRFVDEHSRWSRRVRRPRPGVVTATDGEGSSVM